MKEQTQADCLKKFMYQLLKSITIVEFYETNCKELSFEVLKIKIEKNKRQFVV